MNELQPEKETAALTGLSSEIVLARSFGGLFENRASRVRLTPDAAEITFSDTTTSFAALASARRSAENHSRSIEEVHGSLYSSAGRALNNIGVSVALTLALDGEQYAVCAYRRSSDRLMLISGYVDAHAGAQPDRRVELLSAGLKELREEFLPARFSPSHIDIDMGMLIAQKATGLFTEISLSGCAPLADPSGSTALALGAPYPPEPGSPVRYGSDSMWRVRPTEAPAYLASLHPARSLEIDGRPLSARFHYDKPNDSGQIVFSYELELSGAGRSLFHAETAPDADRPGWLKEVLDTRGIVLLRLDQSGLPSGESYWLLDGELVRRPVDAANLNLSEAFAPALAENGRSSGIVERSCINYLEFRRALAS